MDKLGEVAFVMVGFSNRKKSFEWFDHHSKSSLHKEAVLKIELMKQLDVICMLDSTHNKIGGSQKHATNSILFLDIFSFDKD